MKGQNINNDFSTGTSLESLFMQCIDCLSDQVAEKAVEKLMAKMPSSKPEDEQLLSINETCSLFNPKVTPATIHNWSAQGKLTKLRMGGKVFFRKSEVLASLQSLKKFKRV